MKRYLRFPFLSLVMALILGSLALNAFGKPPADETAEPDGVAVTFEQIDRTKRKGICQAKTLKVKADFGVLDLNLHKVQSITIRKEGEESIASIQMNDHTRMTARLVDTTVPVLINDKTETVVLTELLEIKFLKPKSLSLFAIIVGLITLTIMEIVLGVDNVIFLAIVAGKLPEKERPRARRIGLIFALVTRLLLLFTLSFLLGLTRPLFTIPQLPFFNDPEARDFSARDLILLVGGLFLIYQSVKEMHEKVEQSRMGHDAVKKKTTVKVVSFARVVTNIAFIDILFSLDSVITAVGMVEELWIMVVAMILSMFVMLIFAKGISDFVDRNPTIKILALSFLILIGVMLAAESLGQHIDKGYIYFAMAFAVVIEIVNMKLRPKAAPDADKLA